MVFPFYRTYDVLRQSSAACKSVVNTQKWRSEKAGVGGSTPSLATIFSKDLERIVENLSAHCQPTIQPDYVSLSVLKLYYLIAELRRASVLVPLDDLR